jgi:dephospho-CoA kinase
MARILGITGNIACGKTSVGKMLVGLGVERYIDADAVVHHLYDAGQSIALQVAAAFGAHVVAADGSIDRNALGAIVFHDVEALRQLERIVHPAVGVALQQELALVSERGIAIIDAVKLLEGGSGALCQSKWLIVCSEEQECQRLVERNHMSEEEAWARIRVQPANAPRFALVDEVIDNSGTLQETERQVMAAFARFCERFPA